MEEKGKKIKMENPNKEPQTNQGKLSYEQLENVAHLLSQQNREMYHKLQQAENESFFKRLDYLFKILQFDYMFPERFTETCVKEIQEAITIPEEKKEVKEEDEVKEDN